MQEIRTDTSRIPLAADPLSPKMVKQSTLANSSFSRRTFCTATMATLIAPTIASGSLNLRQDGPEPQESFTRGKDLDLLLERFAHELPETAWRISHRKIMEERRAYSELVNARVNKEVTGDRKVESLEDLSIINHRYHDLMSEWDATRDVREARGNVVFALEPMWSGLVCYDYCFNLLRRHQNFKGNPHNERAIEVLQENGYCPVKEPKEFDVVMYFNVTNEGTASELYPTHWGMVRKGRVVSKNIVSGTVYHHRLEDTATDSKYAMYFRHKTISDPRNLPLPESPYAGVVYRQYGVAVGEVADSKLVRPESDTPKDTYPPNETLRRPGAKEVKADENNFSPLFSHLATLAVGVGIGLTTFWFLNRKERKQSE